MLIRVSLPDVSINCEHMSSMTYILVQTIRLVNLAEPVPVLADYLIPYPQKTRSNGVSLGGVTIIVMKNATQHVSATDGSVGFRHNAWDRALLRQALMRADAVVVGHLFS